MIKNCEYTESTDTMVWDRLVLGIRDAKVQSQLLHIDVDKFSREGFISLSFGRSYRESAQGNQGSVNRKASFSSF